MRDPFHSSCGMPGSGQAMKCTDDDILSHTAEDCTPGVGCQTPKLQTLQGMRVHKGKAGD